jgi:CubicO group peptidase (beta-lactamase class C family)
MKDKQNVYLNMIKSEINLFAALCLLTCFFVLGCKDDNVDTPNPGDNTSGSLYFPPIDGSTWESADPATLGWDTTKIQDLYSFLDDGGTRAFIVLKDGKIVLEHYAGKDILQLGSFTEKSVWYWASAGKTLTSFLVGQAQEDGHLNINDKTSDYLGDWTMLTKGQQDKITVKHQLMMASGLDDSGNSDCTDKTCLTYKADPLSRWAYHNAPYTLLDSVIQRAVNTSFDDYFNSRLRDPIGMDGNWSYLDYNHVYFSSARSMARFGLLTLNKGHWGSTAILGDSTYINAMVNTSQDINKSYGYLWWLNGKESHMLPGLQLVIRKPISENAPSDMISGLGKNGQFLNVVPSQNLVVVRLGDNPDNALVPTKFLNDMWGKINDVVQ